MKDPGWGHRSDRSAHDTWQDRLPGSALVAGGVVAAPSPAVDVVSTRDRARGRALQGSPHPGRGVSGALLMTCSIHWLLFSPFTILGGEDRVGLL